MVDVLSNYSVETPTESQADDVFYTFKPVLIDKPGSSPETIAMNTRKLREAIRYAMVSDNILTLIHDNCIVGAVIVDVRGNRNFIVHSNIDIVHKKSTGSMLLFNEVVNVMFKEEAVYITAVTPEFTSIVTKTPIGLYKINDEAKQTAARFLKIKEL